MGQSVKHLTLDFSSGRGLTIGKIESHIQPAWDSLFPYTTLFRSNKSFLGGTWAAQSIEHLTLDFSSGRDPRVVGSSPALALC